MPRERPRPGEQWRQTQEFLVGTGLVDAPEGYEDGAPATLTNRGRQVAYLLTAMSLRETMDETEATLVMSHLTDVLILCREYALSIIDLLRGSDEE